MAKACRLGVRRAIVRPRVCANRGRTVHVILRLLSLCLMLLLLPLVARASNGLYPVSSGAQAAGRGGADIAVAADATAMATNPAGIMQIEGSRFEGAMGFFLPQAEYRDGHNNVKGARKLYLTPNGAVVIDPSDLWGAESGGDGLYFAEERRQPASDFSVPELPRRRSRWRFGIGSFIEGGAGSHYRIQTLLYQQDPPPPAPLVIPIKPLMPSQDGATFYSKFSLVAITPTVACELAPKLYVGASLRLLYGQMSMDTFLSQPPELLQGTIGPAFPGLPNTFGEYLRLFGRNEINGLFKLVGSTSVGLGGRIGVLWKPTPEWSFGAVYHTRTWMTHYKGPVELSFENEINYANSLFGIPPVGLGDATRVILIALLVADGIDPLRAQNLSWGDISGKFEGSIMDFEFPQQVGFGAAFRPSKRWLLAADLKWINWAKTFERFTVVLEDCNNPFITRIAGTEVINAGVPLEWRNQWALSLGAEFRPTDRWTLRVGYNANTKMVPDETLIPIIPATVQNHIAFGLSYHWNDNLDVHFAWEHAFQRTQETGIHASYDDLSNSRLRVMQDTLWLGSTYRF